MAGIEWLISLGTEGGMVKAASISICGAGSERAVTLTKALFIEYIEGLDLSL